jgi:hypothetical protein
MVRLPDSPVSSMQECLECGSISVKFWNSNYDRLYTRDEWNTVLESGREVLRKILGPVKEDPKFFYD